MSPWQPKTDDKELILELSLELYQRRLEYDHARAQADEHIRQAKIRLGEQMLAASDRGLDTRAIRNATRLRRDDMTEWMRWARAARE